MGRCFLSSWFTQQLTPRSVFSGCGSTLRGFHSHRSNRTATSAGGDESGPERIRIPVFSGPDRAPRPPTLVGGWPSAVGAIKERGLARKAAARGLKAHRP